MEKEREFSALQALRLQLDNKEQVISSLRAQLEMKGLHLTVTDSPSKHSHSPIKDFSSVSATLLCQITYSNHQYCHKGVG